jgi:uncharacterized membrane protein
MKKYISLEMLIIIFLIWGLIHTRIKTKKIENENIKNAEKKIIFIGGSPRSGTTVILLR